MKILKTAILISILVLYSCQDVVDVDLETSKERLVIEALIKWQQDTSGNEQTIKLTKTSSFYNNQPIYVNNANVVIKNLETQQEFDFLLTENGLYKTINFAPVVNTAYELEVSYNSEVYKATATLTATPPILEMTQSTEGGFTEEDSEVNIIFQDFINQEDSYKIVINHYRPSLDEKIDVESTTFNDSFQEDNEFSIFYENEDLLAEDEITITLYKISEQFFNYLEKLGLQADSGFGPFSSPPINVKGNIINSNNVENYPYGYFSLNQIDEDIYIFE